MTDVSPFSGFCSSARLESSFISFSIVFKAHDGQLFLSFWLVGQQQKKIAICV